MSDSASSPPPEAPLPNVVLPPNFNDLAARQQQIARSPLERHAENPPEGGPQELGPHPPGAPDFEARLAASRQQDAAPRQVRQSEPEPHHQDEPKPKGPLEFRSQRQVKNRRANDWNALNATRDQAVAEVDRLRAELAARNGPNGQNGSPDIDFTKLPIEDLLARHPDLKRLKDERDTFYEEVKHTRVESDPEFRAKFDTRRDAAIRIAKSVSGQAGDDIARIMAIKDSDSRREQLADRIKDFGDGSKAKIIAAANALDSLDVEREMEITSRKATWEHTQSARQQQQATAFNQRIAKLDSEFNDVVARWSDPEKGMPFVMHNKDQVVQNAKRIFSGEADAGALAEAAMKASVLPDVLNLAQDAFREIEKLKEQLARYTGVYPGDDSGWQAPAPANGAAIPVDIFNAQHVNDFDRRLQAARMADAQHGGGR